MAFGDLLDQVIAQVTDDNPIATLPGGAPTDGKLIIAALHYVRSENIAAANGFTKLTTAGTGGTRACLYWKVVAGDGATLEPTVNLGAAAVWKLWIGVIDIDDAELVTENSQANAAATIVTTPIVDPTDDIQAFIIAFASVNANKTLLNHSFNGSTTGVNSRLALTAAQVWDLVVVDVNTATYQGTCVFTGSQANRGCIAIFKATSSGGITGTGSIVGAQGQIAGIGSYKVSGTGALTGIRGQIVGVGGRITGTGAVVGAVGLVNGSGQGGSGTPISTGSRRRRSNGILSYVGLGKFKFVGGGSSRGSSSSSPGSIPGTGALTGKKGLIAGTGDVHPAPVTGTGAVTGKSGLISGQGSFRITGTGAVVGSSGLVSGDGNVGTTGFEVTEEHNNLGLFPSGLPQYEELHHYFKSSINAENNFFYYEADIPPGIASAGMSMDIELSRDGFETIEVTNPYVYTRLMEPQLQNFGGVGTVTDEGGKNWILPSNEQFWMTVVSVPEIGFWQYRVRCQTTNGEIVYGPESTSFEVAAGSNKGRLRVSTTDVRYLEHMNGDLFIPTGFNQFSIYDKSSPTHNENIYQAYEDYGINFIRIWMPTYGAHGDAWGNWFSALLLWAGNEPHIPVFPPNHERFANEYLSITPPTPPAGKKMFLWLNMDQTVFQPSGSMFRFDPTRHMGLNGPSVACNSDRPHRLIWRFNIQGLGTPIVVGQPVRGAVKWSTTTLWHLTDVTRRAYYPNTVVTSPNTVTVLATTDGLVGTVTVDPENPDWSICTAFFTTTPTQKFFDQICITLENTSDTGHLFTDELIIQEVISEGVYGPNLIYKPSFGANDYVSDYRAYAIDHLLDQGKRHGVYFLMNMTEKNDLYYTYQNFDGTMSDHNTANDDEDDQLFWGDQIEVTMSPQRYIQRCWWRAVQARWGGRQNFGIAQLLNEGPLHDNHYVLANEFGRFIKHEVFGFTPDEAPSDSPVGHPATTSFSSNSPFNFWTNNIVGIETGEMEVAIDHQYIGKTGSTTTANVKDNARFMDSMNDHIVYSASRGALIPSTGYGMPAIRGELGMAFDTGDTDHLASGADDGVSVFMRAIAHLHHGCTYDMYWGNPNFSFHIFRGTGQTQYDYRDELAILNNPTARFFDDIPLNNGLYENITPTVGGSDVGCIGQKDLTNDKFHCAIYNQTNTWCSYVGGVTGCTETWNAAGLTNTVAFGGFTNDTVFSVLRIQYGRTGNLIVSDTIEITANGSGTVSIDLATFGLNANTAVVLLKAVPQVVQVQTWRMSGGNPQRTSWVAEGPTSTVVQTLAIPFEPYIAQKVQIIAAPTNAPSIDRAFLSTANGLYSIDIGDIPGTKGQIDFAFGTELPLGNASTFYNNQLFVGGLDRKMRCLDAETGALQWEYEATDGISVNPLVLDGVVYFGDRGGKFYALNVSNGALKTGWTIYQVDPQYPILYSAAYNDGVVYFGAGVRIYAIDATDGSEVWISGVLPGQGFYSWWPVVYIEGANVYILATRTAENNNEFSLQQFWLFGQTDPNVDPSGTLPGTSGVDVTSGHKYYLVTDNTGFGDSVINYFKQTPELPALPFTTRRSLFVLDAVDGSEVQWDIMGDASVNDYAPIMHSGKTNNLYPAVIGSDNRLYMRSTNYSQGSVAGISGAVLVAWTLGADRMLLPLSPMLGQSGHWPHDEPVGMSAAGDQVYWSVCSDRGAGRVDPTVANPNFPVNNNGGDYEKYYDGRFPVSDTPPRSITLAHETSGPEGSGFPEVDYWWLVARGWPPAGTTQPGFLIHPQGELQLKYHYGHSDQVGPTPYKRTTTNIGKFMIHRSNAFHLFEDVTPGPNTGQNAPVLQHVPKETTGLAAPTILTTPNLTTRLDTYINKTCTEALSTVGHLRGLQSGWHGVGLFSTQSSNYLSGSDIMHYWHSPYENIIPLLRARPFCQSGTQSLIDQFIDAEYKPIAPLGRAPIHTRRHVGFNTDNNQNPANAPLARSEHVLWNKPATGLQGGTQNEPNYVYALWKYSQQYPGNEVTLYNLIATIGVVRPPDSATVVAPNNVDQYAPHHNRYLAYCYGYMSLFNAANAITPVTNPTAIAKKDAVLADIVVFEALRSNPRRDLMWGASTLAAQAVLSSSYYSVLMHAWNWMFLTDELVQYWITNNQVTHIEGLLDYYMYQAPYWMEVHNTEVQLENGITPYQHQHCLFQAKARILQPTQAEMSKYLDAPIVPYGDMYYIDNLAATLALS